MIDPSPFRLVDPAELRTNAVFSSPHSGRDYPDELIRGSKLDAHALRASEDVLVDTLFEAAPGHGAPLLCATAPRAWLDLNRAPTELDPLLIDGVREQGINQRVAAGLGVVPRVVSEGAEIYEGRLSLAQARERIDGIHAPYHRKLEALLTRARRRYGSALLFDCHSMPSEALRAAPRVRGRCPEIVLGDRFGVAAGRAIVSVTQAAFERAGFVVARNAPFAGGYITQRYGRPAHGLNAVQIEIDRGLYLDQKSLEASTAFADVRARIGGVIAELVAATPDLSALAAE
ncbi:MAG: N-formylglutamate amidohydrolase [Pseudomonadota bacterium]